MDAGDAYTRGTLLNIACLEFCRGNISSFNANSFVFQLGQAWTSDVSCSV